METSYPVLPPKAIWGNQGMLIEWAREAHKFNYDKAKSWARGFMAAGAK